MTSPEVQPYNISLCDYVNKTVSLPLSGSWNPNAEADLVKVYGLGFISRFRKSSPWPCDVL